jgi:hypothetical protein
MSLNLLPGGYMPDEDDIQEMNGETNPELGLKRHPYTQRYGPKRHHGYKPRAATRLRRGYYQIRNKKSFM